MARLFVINSITFAANSRCNNGQAPKKDSKTYNSAKNPCKTTNRISEYLREYNGCNDCWRNHTQQECLRHWVNEQHSCTTSCPSCRAKLLLTGEKTIDQYHRSHSPNTMSSAPKIAVVSASMCPRDMKSMACKCENAVGRILQR